MEAIVKIGRINILQDNLDQAFELYEPLVDTLIKKQKVEKAIGLLGLILSSEKVHIPSLEGLASIYKSNNQKKNLEIVYRIILEEYHKKKLRKESLSILSELVKLCPEDGEVKNEYNLLRKEIGLPKEEKGVELPPIEPEEVEELPVEPKKAEVPLRKERETEVHLEEEKGVELPPKEAGEAEEPLVEPKEAEEPLKEEKETEVRLEKEREVGEPLMKEAETEVHEVRLEEEKGVELPPEEPKEAEEPLMEEAETEVHEVQLEEEKEVELPLKEQREAEESLMEPKEAEEPLMEEGKTEVHEVGLEEEKEVELPPEEATEVEEPLVEPKEAEEPLKEEREPKVRLEEEKEVGKPITEEKELEVPLVEKKKADGRLELLEGTEERLEMSLAQADLYLEQGLLRNARRILENLRLSYPDDPRIDEKIVSISKLSSQAKVEEILQRVEKVSEQETQLFGKKAYFRFNLGIAFLEQGLIDEAVEEFKLASKDKSRAVECYTVISNCYRQKKDFQEATKWVEKALKLSKVGSDWFYALKYELASLYEELKETNKALALYEEIKKWNSEYKDVVNKIKILEKKLQK